MGKGDKTAGVELEHRVKKMLDHYRVKQIAVGLKMDPPMKAFSRGYPVYGENNFLDFTGCRYIDGRMFHIEAKHTKGGTLPINRDWGITGKQIKRIMMWAEFNAIIGVIWWSDVKGYVWFDYTEILGAYGMDHPSIDETEGDPIPMFQDETGEMLPDFKEFIQPNGLTQTPFVGG